MFSSCALRVVKDLGWRAISSASHRPVIYEECPTPRASPNTSWCASGCWFTVAGSPKPPGYWRDCAAWRNLLMIPFVSVQSQQKANDTDVPVHQSGKDAHKRQALEPHCHQPWLLLRIKQRSSHYHL
jgi:hypothetical protein